MPAALFGQKPVVSFTENKGQWPAQVLYRANIPGGALFVEKKALTYVLHSGGEMHQHGGDAPVHPEAQHAHAYRVTFEGAQDGTPAGEQKQAQYENFFIGNDPADWGTGCGVFGEVWVKGVYPGIDLHMDGRYGLKYDLIVAAGADPDVIRMRYEGQDGMQLVDGELRISTTAGNIAEEAPRSWIDLFNGVGIIRKPVPSKYHLRGSTVSFDVVAPTAGPLTIDPTLTFGSYTGSTADNFGFTATYDDDGHLYGGGIVFGIGYPTTLGVLDPTFNGSTIDIGISKWLPDGTGLVWSTYIGGAVGNESPHSLVVNDNDELFMLGSSGSSDFPTTVGCFDNTFGSGPALMFGIGYGYSHVSGVDIVVAHFNAACTALIGSTYVGGSNSDGINNAVQLAYNYGDSFRGEIALDGSGNPVVATSTTSSDIPTTPGASQSALSGVQDGYIFRMNPDLTTQLWATYEGGSGNDSGYGVQIDSNGNVFLTGGTTSSDLPLAGIPWDASSNGLVDGYVVKFSPTGTRVAGTYLGTPAYDQSYFVQLDLSDNVYVTGQSEGPYPQSPGKYSNPGSAQFIQKLSNDLSTSLWSTQIGTGNGTVDISPSAFLVSDCGQIYFCGWGGTVNFNGQADFSTTTGLVTSPGCFQSTTDGSDFYLMVLEPDAIGLNYATFFGGSTSHEHVDGGTSRFDKNGNVYQAVCAGCGGNDDFPTTVGAWSQTNNSFNCNLGVFKFNLNQPIAQIDIAGPNYVCMPGNAIFDNLSIGGSGYFWDFGDGIGTSTQFEPTYTYNDTGLFVVTMILTDSTACTPNDTAHLTIAVVDPGDASIDPVDTVCTGSTVQLQASGGYAYSWFPATGLSSTTIPDPVATPPANITYSVIVTDSCGTDTVSVDIITAIGNGHAGPDTLACLGNSVPITASGGGTYLWAPSSTLNDPSLQAPTATPLDTTVYVVAITSPDGCLAEDSLTVFVQFDPPVPITNDTATCIGSSVQISVSGGDSYLWQSASGLTSNLNSASPTVTPPAAMWYHVMVSNACADVPDSVFVDVIEVIAAAWPDTIVCPGQAVTLYASGGSLYTWSPSTGLSTTSGASTTATPVDSTTYQVVVSDAIGCSDTAFVTVAVFPEPNVYAGADMTIVYGDALQLNSTGGPGTYAWSPNVFITCIDCEDPIVAPEQSTLYTVMVTDTNGCVAVDEVFVVVEGTLYVPNTFTPNGDGHNDIFFALATEVKEFELYVFDRWGLMIWSGDDPRKSWDGTYGGSPAPIDTYVWRIDLTELSGERHKIYGHVNLVR